MATPVTTSAKRVKKTKAAAASGSAATGQVQSLTRGLKLLEYIAEAQGSVALTDLAPAGRVT
ncbi:Acetate operon repressor [Ewingella americana]|uniref:Acetate operon repressor n=1 Tax=Ewingella americana TaxID=41202 RepID=A0A377N5A4_9GAMM|nr:Acetate operon repressor [Ewingella americana]